MRKIGLISLLIGLFIVAFPSFVGGFVIGSAAFIIALLSLFSLTVLILGGRYLASSLSLLFLIASVRIMYYPHLLLKYVGAALILSSLVQILIMHRKSVLVSSGFTLVLGILAYINSQASLAVTTVILGILFAGVGGLMMFWDSFVSKIPNNTIRFWNYKPTDSPSGKTVRNIKIDEDIEEAKFTEIDE
ncbi:MAG: hypothetical protein Q4A41_04970 [Bacillota bacterium]|nr:hypothetical protein [Bacillota bacterium]